MFTSTVLAIPMLFAVNMDFYDLHQVSVDAEGITTHHYMSSDEHVSWVDVRAVEVDEGALFPVVTDDRSLRFVDAEGAACSVPRYVPQAEAIAAGALGHLRAAALRTGAKEATP